MGRFDRARARMEGTKNMASSSGCAITNKIGPRRASPPAVAFRDRLYTTKAAMKMLRRNSASLRYSSMDRVRSSILHVPSFFIFYFFISLFLFYLLIYLVI